MSENERIEWTRCWREDADREGPRVLLIGDSVVEGIKHEVYDALPDEIATTVITTSKGVCSPYFCEEIELFCCQEPCDYRVAYFNNGLHPHGQSPEEYARAYRAALVRLRASLPGVKVWILGLSTPITRQGGGADHETPITDHDPQNLDLKNKLVCQYNREVLRIADEFGLEILDAYSLLVGHPEYKTDSYHYNADGKALLGAAVAKKIKEALAASAQ